LAAARASFSYLQEAARAVIAGSHHALVTAPVNKAWIVRTGREFNGHTDYLSALAGVKAVMMLCGRTLRVVLVTVHIAHADVSRSLTTAGICKAARTTHTHLRRYHGLRRPKLVVAALNPHAGEAGLFGDEETRVIRPAVRRLCREGLRVEGPKAADSLFAAAATGEYDAVICMYHDQGLIALKLTDFGRAVNVSMGLPFIRTSPDHGTAYELTGSGRSDSGSMAEAILTAARMAG
jgi:4-hydroxythreonine-4-phosphate dehydrogenase